MAQNNQQKGQDASQLEKVRREKLAELQAAGRDPFQIVKFNQTYHSEQIRRDFDELGWSKIDASPCALLTMVPSWILELCMGLFSLGKDLLQQDPSIYSDRA